MSEQSLAHGAHKFAVATIDEDRLPHAVLSIVEGNDWDEASRFAYSLAREEVHKNDHIVMGVFEVDSERATLIATAGFARFSGGVSKKTPAFALLAAVL